VTLTSASRLAAVERLIADTAVHRRLDRLVAHAARLLGAPCAQVSLIGETEQFIAAASGFALTTDTRRGPVADSLCTVTVTSGQNLIVSDARLHPLVRHLPPVTSGAVRSYAGALLIDGDHHVLGSLCVFGPDSRDWSDQQIEQLDDVAGLVSAELDANEPSLPTELGLRANAAAGAAELGSFLYDFAGGGRLDLDEQMLALHGLRADSFDGTRAAFEAVMHPDDLAHVGVALAQARAGLAEVITEYRAVLPDGQRRWIRVRGRVMPDLRGQPSHVVGTAYDASTERNLRDELSRLMETMPAGLVRLDQDWRFSYVNAVAERIYDRSRADLVGQGVFDVFPDMRGTVFDEVYAEAMSSGEPRTLEAYFQPLASHFEVAVWPDDAGLTLFFLDVTARKDAQDALEVERWRLARMADAGERLSRSLQPTEVLEVLSDVLLPDLAGSIRVAVTQPIAELLGRTVGADSDRLHPVRVGRRETDVGVAGRLVPGIQRPRRHTSSVPPADASASSSPAEEATGGEVPRQRSATRRREPDEGPPEVGPQMTLPLMTPNGVVGSLTVTAGEHRQLDEVLLRDLAGRAAVALENALTFARQHRAAMVLQRALLPRVAPGLPGVLVATRYLPAAEQALAGGDFFKTVTVDGRLVCALGDVMGHGTASAARAGQLHGLVAVLALQGFGPGELLGHLSRGVHQMMDLDLATLLVCSYDPSTRQLTAATAGHPPPLIAPLDEQPFYLDVDPGPPIGVAAADFVERTVDLAQGSVVVLFSDGLVERRGESLTTGLERLRAGLAGAPLSLEGVADHVLEHNPTVRGSDDIALLVLSHP
jgi:PAS domain S-box-containing protein